MAKTPTELLSDALWKRLIVTPEMVEEMDFTNSGDPTVLITFQLRVPQEVWQECLRAAHPEEAIADG